MEFESLHWEKSQLLSELFVRKFDCVKELYTYDPHNEDIWGKRAEWLDSSVGLRADRSGLVAALLQYNRKVGNKAESIHAIETLLDARSLVVVGGQQAGLFTGPLLVIYKAITLLQVAKRAAKKLQRPVIPVFWIAGEDHDFDEVNHIDFLTSALQIERLRLERPAGSRTAISQTPFTPSDWDDVVRQLGDSLMDTEFKPNLMARLNLIARQSSTLTDFFAFTLSWLFGSEGLVLIDSDDPAVRQLEGVMFRQMISERHRLNRAFEIGKNKVEAADVQPQAEVQKDCVNLFAFHGEERTLLYEADGWFTDRKGVKIYDERELMDLAEHSPERLSNNVLTRPLMQEFLFPVLATVLGPGETAYWALTGEAFRTLQMQMPIIIPRLEFTLMERNVQKQMTKYDFSFLDVATRFDEKRQQWLDEQDNLQLGERFAEVKARFADLYKPLLETIAELNPGIGKLGETNLQKIIEQIDFLENRANGAFQSQFEAALRQMERIQLSLLPLGKPQERVYNVFAFLNKYGDDWLRELIDTSIEADGSHVIASL